MWVCAGGGCRPLLRQWLLVDVIAAVVIGGRCCGNGGCAVVVVVVVVDVDRSEERRVGKECLE